MSESIGLETLNQKELKSSNGGKRVNKCSASPWDNASVLTKYTLSFVLALLWRAWNNDLKLDDLSRPPREDQSKLLGERLEHYYRIECNKFVEDQYRSTNGESNTKTRRPRQNLVRALFKLFGLKLLLANLFNTLTRKAARGHSPVLKLQDNQRDAQTFIRLKLNYWPVGLTRTYTRNIFRSLR
jgi:hypothetical protein